MTKTSLLVVYLLSFVCGCAAIPEKQAAGDPRTVCVREYRVGSNIPVVTCEVPKTDAERQQMIDDVRSNVRPLPQRVPTGGAGG